MTTSDNTQNCFQRLQYNNVNIYLGNMLHTNEDEEKKTNEQKNKDNQFRSNS